jgi:large subunit ribosomal protein L32
MAVPKRRTSSARRDRRRSAKSRLTIPNVAECPQCHEPKLPHRVCAACGYYNGKEVMTVEE